MKLTCKFILLAAVFSSFSYADLIAIKDSELNNFNAQNSAIAATLDDFYLAGDELQIVLDFDSGIPLTLLNTYLVKDKDAYFTGNTQGIDYGDYNDPFTLDLNNVASINEAGQSTEKVVLRYSFPTGNYRTSNPSLGKFDLGTLVLLEHNSGVVDNTWFLFSGSLLDNSSLSMWALDQGGFSLNGAINLHVDEVTFQTQTVNGNQPSTDPVSSWRLNNLDMYLPLGFEFFQPLTLSTTEDQHLVLELAAITPQSAGEFYSQDKGYLTVESAAINNWQYTDNPASLNHNDIFIEGIRLQHLRIETHDLD